MDTGNASIGVKVSQQRKTSSSHLRLEILKLLCERKDVPETAAAVGVPQYIVYKIWKRKEMYLQFFFENSFLSGKVYKRGKFLDLERAVVEWYIMKSKYGETVTQREMLKKTKEMASELGFLDFQSQYAWLISTLNKHSIILESDVPDDGKDTPVSICTDIVAESSKYNSEDVYTLFEFGMMFKTLTNKFREPQKSDELTVLVACNQTGRDKRDLVVIGKEELEHCSMNLPCTYFYDEKAWMTSDVFVYWLLKFDQEMAEQKRHVLMILKNIPIHLPEIEKDLQNTKLAFVETDDVMTTQIHYEISFQLKLHFRVSYVTFLTEMRFTLSTVKAMDALHMLNQAWRKMKADDISSIFNQAFCTQSEVMPNEPIAIPGLSQEETKLFVDHDKDLPCFGQLTDIEICERVLIEKVDGNLDMKDDKELQDMNQSTSMVVTLANLQKLRDSLSGIGLKDLSPFYTVEGAVMDQLVRNKQNNN